MDSSLNISSTPHLEYAVLNGSSLLMKLKAASQLSRTILSDQQINPCEEQRGRGAPRNPHQGGAFSSGCMFGGDPHPLDGRRAGSSWVNTELGLPAPEKEGKENAPQTLSATSRLMSPPHSVFPQVLCCWRQRPTSS